MSNDKSENKLNDISTLDKKNSANVKLLHTFANGFGTISILLTISYTESAHAGSAVFGPCGVHYT